MLYGVGTNYPSYGKLSVLTYMLDGVGVNKLNSSGKLSVLLHINFEYCCTEYNKLNHLPKSCLASSRIRSEYFE